MIHVRICKWPVINHSYFISDLSFHVIPVWCGVVPIFLINIAVSHLADNLMCHIHQRMILTELLDTIFLLVPHSNLILVLSLSDFGDEIFVDIIL